MKDGKMAAGSREIGSCARIGRMDVGHSPR
ncbi:hypothetical protein CGRA01v4_11421 [Colletotrichum graminicola]|nr:hypothetical protein CGRA01v4_11421 [Colletotrichum graminicola]